MGEVYKARDTHLNRFVAIKFMQERLLDNEKAVTRFQREVKALSALTHPNICSVFDAGNDEGRPFIVMEFLEGVSFQEMIREAPLDIDRLIEVAIQLCAALQAAHAKSIIHRDIKPSNIMMSSTGHPKILDFGLAKFSPTPAIFGEVKSIDSTWSADLSGKNEMVGTIGYMSPEQVKLNHVDHRSDLFSLGVVLYQLATGKHPFRADSLVEFCRNITDRNPLAASTLNPSLPQQLDAFFERALEKDVRRRFQSAADMQADLAHIQYQITSGSGSKEAVDRKSRIFTRVLRFLVPLGLSLIILILLGHFFLPRPARFLWFTFLPDSKRVTVFPVKVQFCPGEEQLPFAAGLKNDLLAEIHRRNRSGDPFLAIPHFDGVNTVDDARKILQVNMVIEPELYCMEDNRARFDLKLIDAMHGGLLETDHIIGSLNERDSFVEWARAVSSDWLGLMALAPGEGALAAAPGLQTKFIEAKGLLSDFYDFDDIDRAIILLRQIVDQSPEYARAHAKLAEAYYRKFRLNEIPEWIREAENSAEKAIELDPALTEAHFSYGLILELIGQTNRAMEEFARVLEEDPTNYEVLIQLGLILKTQGKIEEAVDHYQKAIEVRPDFWAGYHYLARFYEDTGDYDKAIQYYTETRDRIPESYLAWSNLAIAYYRKDDFQSAIPLLEKSLELKENYQTYNLLGAFSYMDGELEQAAEYYTMALEIDSSDHNVWQNLGGVYRELGNQELAAENFQKALDVLLPLLEKNPSDIEYRLNQADLLSDLGRSEESRQVLESCLEAPSLENETTLIYLVAQILEKLGDRDRAIDWTIRAIEHGYEIKSIEKSPTMQDLMQDPAFINRLPSN
jgi:tetratricopeptide (TPR) repeat protein